jgi:hypothetical protein
MRRGDELQSDVATLADLEGDMTVTVKEFLEMSDNEQKIALSEMKRDEINYLERSMDRYEEHRRMNAKIQMMRDRLMRDRVSTGC